MREPLDRPAGRAQQDRVINRFRTIAAALALAFAAPAAAQDIGPALAALTPASRVAGEPVADAAFVRAVYAANGGAALWSNPARFAALQRAVANSVEDGLTPADYHAKALASLPPGAEREILATDALARLVDHLSYGKVHPHGFEPSWNFGPSIPPHGVTPAPQAVQRVLAIAAAPDLPAAVAATAPSHPIYRQVRAELARYRSLEARGGWPKVGPGDSIKPGDRSPRVAAIAARLTATGDLPANAARADPQLYDVALKASVVRFQTRMGLAADGAVGPGTIAALDTPAADRIRLLRINLDRARVLMADLPPRFVIVNIAGFQVYVVEGTNVVWRSRVIVGKPFRQTPIFKSAIDHIIFNPTWTVPPTILKQDIAPKARRNPSYVTGKGLQVINPAGKVVSPASVNWSNPSGYTLRQPPGPENALGRVKFMFPNSYSVYLHDTPSKTLFDTPMRTLSSGCVRVQNPMELAELLLRPEDPSWTRAKIDGVVATEKLTQVNLAKPVPVLLAYWTAWVDNNGLMNFRPDVYDRDPAWLKALDAPLV